MQATLPVRSTVACTSALGWSTARPKPDGRGGYAGVNRVSQSTTTARPDGFVERGRVAVAPNRATSTDTRLLSRSDFLECPAGVCSAACRTGATDKSRYSRFLVSSYARKRPNRNPTRWRAHSGCRARARALPPHGPLSQCPARPGRGRRSAVGAQAGHCPAKLRPGTGRPSHRDASPPPQEPRPPCPAQRRSEHGSAVEQGYAQLQHASPQPC